MCKYLKINKRLNLVVSKPENRNLRRKTTISIELEISGKNRHSFIADNKLQVDQIKRKMEANFDKPLFI